MLWEVDREIAKLASKLCRENDGLKPPDAVHIATALTAKVSEIHTYDMKDLGKFNGKIGDPLMTIVEPPALAVQATIENIQQN